MRDISPRRKSGNVFLFIVAALEWVACGGKSCTLSSFAPWWIHNRSFRAQPVIRIAAIRIVPIFYPKVALELVAEGASESYCGSMENPD